MLSELNYFIFEYLKIYNINIFKYISILIHINHILYNIIYNILYLYRNT